MKAQQVQIYKYHNNIYLMYSRLKCQLHQHSLQDGENKRERKKERNREKVKEKGGGEGSSVKPFINRKFFKECVSKKHNGGRSEEVGEKCMFFVSVC